MLRSEGRSELDERGLGNAAPGAHEVPASTPVGLPPHFSLESSPTCCLCLWEAKGGGGGVENSGQASIISLQMDRLSLDCHRVSLRGESWSQPELVEAPALGKPCRKSSGNAAFGL